MTHTPGPWVVLFDNAGGGRNIGIEHKGRFIGIAHTGAVRAPNVLHGREPIEEDEAKANATLIAGAPELLAALKALHACHRAFSSAENWTALDDEARDAAEAAITKATAIHPPDSEKEPES